MARKIMIVTILELKYSFTVEVMMNCSARGAYIVRFVSWVSFCIMVLPCLDIAEVISS